MGLKSPNWNERRMLLTMSSLVWMVVMCRSVHGGEHMYPAVTYDARSLIINGSRELLFSGSIHYPRTQPEARINYIYSFFTKLIKQRNSWSYQLYICIDVSLLNLAIFLHIINYIYRCGRICWTRQKQGVWMLSRHTYSGMSMSLFKARYVYNLR